MQLVTVHTPPEKRRPYAVGGMEEKFTEAAIMLAMATYILQAAPAGTVAIHPDGEHTKRFDIPSWLARAGFVKIKSVGLPYAGLYARGDDKILVHPRSGLGDVVGEIHGQRVVVECKGGTINTTHSGQLSRLRKGLCEAVGLLLARSPDGAREIAAVPYTPVLARLAERMAPRCIAAGIEIALVQPDGSLIWPGSAR